MITGSFAFTVPASLLPSAPDRLDGGLVASGHGPGVAERSPAVVVGRSGSGPIFPAVVRWSGRRRCPGPPKVGMTAPQSLSTRPRAKARDRCCRPTAIALVVMAACLGRRRSTGAVTGASPTPGRHRGLAGRATVADLAGILVVGLLLAGGLLVPAREGVPARPGCAGPAAALVGGLAWANAVTPGRAHPLHVLAQPLPGVLDPRCWAGASSATSRSAARCSCRRLLALAVGCRRTPCAPRRTPR